VETREGEKPQAAECRSCLDSYRLIQTKTKKRFPKTTQVPEEEGEKI